MAVAFPQLEVYYIDFSEEKKGKDIERNELGEGLLSAAQVIAQARFVGYGLIGVGITSLITVCASLTPSIVRSLKRLINENRFFIIKSQQTLKSFENACGNDWVINEKSLKQKQYYVRHPKMSNRNLLIEAKSFYDYIEEEQKDELVDYILSHCPAKHIKIEKIDVASTKGKASAKVKNVDPEVDLEAGMSKKNIFNYRNPKGTKLAPAHSQYVWLDNSIMRSISALDEGGSVTQSYESDFTFGMSVGEAKTIGLDISKYKKYTYSIYVEC